MEWLWDILSMPHFVRQPFHQIAGEEHILELTQIRYFLSVAKHRNFTRAAEELYTSQPTISKQIALLEKELGVQLFPRDKQGAHMTYVGQQLYPSFEKALELIDTAVQQATKSADDVQGQINVGIGSMLDINHVLPGFLRAFSLAYPKITLSIHSYPFAVLRQKLSGGELDIIFTYSLEQDSKQTMRRMRVSRSDCYLYYPVSLIHKPQDMLTLKDFVNMPLLKLKGHSPAGDAYQGISFQHVTEVADMETMILSLESGLGFCIMGRSYRINTGDNIRSIDLTKTNHLPPVGTDAIWLKSNQKNALSVLLDEMKAYIQGERI